MNYVVSSSRYIPLLTVEEFTEEQPHFDMVEGQRGTVHVCPECGTAWAKVTLFSIVGDTPRRMPYKPVEHRCVEHGGGSFLTKYVHAISPHLGVNPRFGPKTTLREYDTAIAQSKENKDGTNSNLHLQ